MTTTTSVARLQELYDQNRFLEAYRQSAAYWTSLTRLDDFSAEELVLGARLAARLGGGRQCRWILRAALKKHRTNARVLYFSWNIRRRDGHLFDELRQREARPELANADAEVQASWLASQAVVWASLRDFAQARRCIERAHFYSPEDSWVLSCESTVLGYEDRWEEALISAERGWEVRPGTPYGAVSLGQGLLNLRRLNEAATRLGAAAENCESFEIAHLTCWYLCALAESNEGDDQRRLLRRAKRLCERFTELAPLADRESRALFARAWLDVASLEDDHEAMERWAEEARSPFHQTVLKNLRQNPQGRRIRLAFRPAIQKYDACLPTSIASALGAMGVMIDPDLMAKELTFGGTPEWAAAEWLEKRGLAVRFFLATPEIAARLVQNGIAFVVTLEADTSAHAVAVVGLDEAAGTLLIHDPQALRTSEYLLEFFGRGEAPLGPKGMAIVPGEKAAVLDALLPRGDVETMTATEAHQRAILHEGPAAGLAIVERLQRNQPSHPTTRLLRAVQALEEGRVGPALGEFQELFQQFPNSAFTRSRILVGCRLIGNTALMRRTLASVVEGGMLPGIQSQQDWVRPPGAYVSEYAGLLGTSAEGNKRARTLLLGVLAREGGCAQAWHALGELLWQESDKDGASLAYRIASCLAGSNEHYARAYCDALGNGGHEADGLKWLEDRVDRFGESTFGVATWVTWIAALEDWGHPEQALAASERALVKHGESPDLLWFVVPFLGRMGQWERAETLLKGLQAGKSTTLYQQAAVNYCRMRGDLSAAIDHAEAWVREAPHYMRARHELLQLLAKRDSVEVALQRSWQWLRQHPGHDELEQLHCSMLDRESRNGIEKYAILLRRVQRNPEDAWAWRELAFLCIAEYRLAEGKRQARIGKRVERFLAKSERTAPGDPSTLRVRAEWDDARGQWVKALDGWLASIAREPGSGYAYQQVLDILGRLNAEKREFAWRRIEELLPTHPGRLGAVRDIAMRAGRQLSVATVEQSLTTWRKLRPDDPDLIEATADLLLEHGLGRTDAQRALAMLTPAAERFPYHSGLRFSLADAFRKLGRISEAEDVLAEMARRHPDSTPAQIQFATGMQRQGRFEEALRVLDTAAERDPQNPEIWDVRAQILLAAGRREHARTVVEEGLQRFARDVRWRERAIKFCADCGDAEGAIAAAREGVCVFPRGAYLWYMLGRALSLNRQFAAPGEIESCLRRSLALNQQLMLAADQLTMYLVEQRRYSDAEEVMKRIAERLNDPSPAQGRIAWIHREDGKKSEARQELAGVVAETPWYFWGWTVLMEWLVEDQARDETLRILCKVPPELATNAQFRRQRLTTLEKAAIATAESDTEWSSLLRDFPEDVALYLYRYDSLRDAQRFPEAETVLRQILPVDPHSPYVLARLVEVLTRESSKKDEAANAMLQVFFSGVEESTWPATFAWSALKKVHWEKDVYEKARARMQAGELPTRTVVPLLAKFAFQQGGTEEKPLQPRWRTWLPDRGAKEVLSLLRFVDGSRKPAEVHRASLLRQISNMGYHRVVVRYWKRHRAQVELDVETWAETGRALVGLRKYAAARKLIAGWRGRMGVPMWAITNYMICLYGLNRRILREVFATCQDALAGLTHDHCAKYLAHRQAEAALLMRDEKAFLETWKEHRNYFDAKLTEPEWFETRRRHLLTDIPIMGRALEGHNLKMFRKMRRSIRWKEVGFAMPRWLTLTPAKPASTNTKISYRWVWLLFWILWLLARVAMDQK